MAANPGLGLTCPQVTQHLSVTHPYGVTGTFELHQVSHRNSYNILEKVVDSCPGDIVPGGSGVLWQLRLNRIMSVTRKTISGTGLGSLVWTYAYESDQGPAGTSGSDRTNETTVTEPSGRKVVYRHYWTAELWGGKLASKEIRQGSQVLQREDDTYTQEASYGFSLVSTATTPAFTYSPTHVTQMQLARDGDTYTTDSTYNTDQFSTSYSFGQPVSVSVYSNVSTTPRTTTTSYVHMKNIWVLGLPATIAVNGLTKAAFTYDTRGRKTVETRYGAPYATFGYYNSGVNNGAMNWVQNALGLRTTALSWNRGVPQQITRPDGISTYLGVDNNGWLTSSTDALGFVTSFSRDSMGRLTKITPSKTQAAWLDTDISYSFGANTVVTATKGNARTVITYDGLNRPVLEQTRDLSTGISTYVNTAYDAMGQIVFASQPSASPVETAGMTMTYDALGRVTGTAETVAPFAATSTAYLSGHQTRFTDAAGQQTITTFDGYGGPGKGRVTAIAQPLGVSTTLTRNIQGQLTSLRQWGTQNNFTMDQTRTYTYDAQQRLCRYHESEGGDTLYSYDAAGQMVAYSKGNGAGSSCAAPAGNSRVDLFYDNLGRNWATLFADPATPDITRTFDANGKPTIVARNAVNWFYFYNELGLMTAEIFQMDGLNFGAGYNYNTAGQVESRNYPSGLALVYDLDGLGRRTKVQSLSTVYASAISYHPSGALAAMSYGNGQMFSQTLNARLQPLHLRSAYGSAVALDLTYAYDARGKVTTITDAVDNTNNRTYGYDALGRITSASGPWGAGSFTYDALGNLRTKTLGSRVVTNDYYDTSNRIKSSDDGGTVRTITHDARGNVIGLGDLSFVYDLSDQPVSVDNLAHTVTGVYTYDGNKKRVKSDINGKIIYNIFDHAGALMEVYDTSTMTRTDYIRAGGTTVARVSNGVATYLHQDTLGSAATGTRASDGSVAWTEHYTPYGETTLNPPANDNLDGFTGHIKDKATGLNYMQARYYDPRIGQFLSIDPVNFSPDKPFMFGRYTYVGGDPVNGVDPFGLCGNRKKDGSCEVKVDKSTGEAGKKAGKALEARLNKFDKIVNKLSDKTTISIKNKNGKNVGSLTGKEFKTIWNNTKFSITSKKFNNGGAGGGAIGGFNKNGFFKGSVALNSVAVESYRENATAIGVGANAGVDTLIFHEYGHLTRPGGNLIRQFPVTPTINMERETKTSTIGAALAATAGAAFVCSIPGGCN